MIFEIIENQSGEVLHREALPKNSPLDIEVLTDDWLETQEFSRDISEGIIPSTCGDYRSEIRNRNTTSLWEALDWFSRPL